jgi:TetR/AcrR family transcriptional repressor of lmrAB and yxaGH operons
MPSAASGERARGSDRDRERAAPPSSRDAFVIATAALLRRQGYAATGLKEIVARSEAPRGSLYFHFPGGKEQLATAAIERSGRELAGAIEVLLCADEDLADGVAALVDGLAVALERSGYSDGCPVATVALEAAATSETVREAAAGAFAAWLAAIERRMIAAGGAPAEAQRRALLVLSAIEGALLLARVQRDPAPLHAVRDELAALLG